MEQKFLLLGSIYTKVQPLKSNTYMRHWTVMPYALKKIFYW